jgi:type IV secretory pathway TrbF-like protein
MLTSIKHIIDVNFMHYLAARREWDERRGNLISRERNWKIMAVLSSLTDRIRGPHQSLHGCV